MSSEFKLINSTRSYRRYKAKGWQMQLWVAELAHLACSADLAFRSSAINQGEAHEQGAIRRHLSEGNRFYEVRAYPPDVAVEDKRFDFFFRDDSPGINPKSLREAANYHENAPHAATVEALNKLPVGGKLRDADGSYIVRIK